MPAPRLLLACLVATTATVAAVACCACSKTDRSGSDNAADAAASSSTASAVASASSAPVIPRCDPASCSDKCTCGEAATCTGGRCVREPAWKIEELALGRSSFACARYTNGRVQCAGQNSLGQLGRGARTPGKGLESPATVKEVEGATRIVAGAAHACALAKDGRVWCWGSGANGELGSGKAETDSPTPRLVSGLADATALWAGNMHTCAIRRSGDVACWGLNDRGQLGDGTKANRASPVEVGGVTGATKLALATYHSCAVAKDGLVLCWGQRGAPSGVAAPLGVPKSDQIGASQDELCVGVAGKVSCFGPSMTKTLTVVPGFADATQLSGGDGLMCALRKNGTVTCGDWWAAADGKVADRATEARGLAVGGAFECVVGKDDGVTCNAGLPTKAVVEQL